MLSHHHLIVEMAERQREIERLVYPKGQAYRRVNNHIYRHLALWWDPVSLKKQGYQTSSRSD